jgi:hypothetical protein
MMTDADFPELNFNGAANPRWSTRRRLLMYGDPSQAI